MPPPLGNEALGGCTCGNPDILHNKPQRQSSVEPQTFVQHMTERALLRCSILSQSHEQGALRCLDPEDYILLPPLTPTTASSTPSYSNESVSLTVASSVSPPPDMDFPTHHKADHTRRRLSTASDCGRPRTANTKSRIMRKPKQSRHAMQLRSSRLKRHLESVSETGHFQTHATRPETLAYG